MSAKIIKPGAWCDYAQFKYVGEVKDSDTQIQVDILQMRINHYKLFAQPIYIE